MASLIEIFWLPPCMDGGWVNGERVERGTIWPRKTHILRYDTTRRDVCKSPWHDDTIAAIIQCEHVCVIDDYTVPRDCGFGRRHDRRILSYTIWRGSDLHEPGLSRSPRSERIALEIVKCVGQNPCDFTANPEGEARGSMTLRRRSSDEVSIS